jgi:hypothetical protein
MSIEEAVHPRLEHVEQQGWHYVPRTQVPLAIDPLTDITSRLSRVDQKVEDHSEWFKGAEERFFGAMMSMEGRIESAMKAMEVRFEGHIKRIEGSITQVDASVKDVEAYVRRVDVKVDALGPEFVSFKKPFEELKRDVKDLVSWKHKVWGMVLLVAVIGPVGTAAFSFISTHIEWKSSSTATATAVAVPSPMANH